MPLSNIQVPVYLLLSTMLPGRKPSLVQREVPDFLYMDETTTAQDVINALIPKHLHPAQIPNYALYQTELVVPLNSTKMKDDVLQRQFSRALEPDEIPLFKVLHDIYTQPGKDKTFYIKKRDANETVSIFADLRREQLRGIPLETLDRRKDMIDTESQRVIDAIKQRHAQQLLDLQNRMRRLGYEVPPSMKM